MGLSFPAPSAKEDQRRRPRRINGGPVTERVQDAEFLAAAPLTVNKLCVRVCSGADVGAQSVYCQSKPSRAVMHVDMFVTVHLINTHLSEINYLDS